MTQSVQICCFLFSIKNYGQLFVFFYNGTNNIDTIIQISPEMICWWTACCETRSCYAIIMKPETWGGGDCGGPRSSTGYLYEIEVGVSWQISCETQLWGSFNLSSECCRRRFITNQRVGPWHHQTSNQYLKQISLPHKPQASPMKKKKRRVGWDETTDDRIS